MLDPQASRFWQATLRSGLMEAEGLTACWNAVPPAKRDFPEHIDRRLAWQAVQSGALTLWQAQQLLAGRTDGFEVDRYVLLNLIGQGGMGRVYLARDTRLTRQVALKILSSERVNNPRAIARFQREARVGAQLQHENLVRIYDFGESCGRHFLVMEYIEGKTVGAFLHEQGPMPAATAVRLVRQVALGLDHAHRKGLIHRDVNPYNILVTPEGTAKLADLGLAINRADVGRVTRDGATLGTFDYIAPEQARHSSNADIRSDIYSLGCTLYHMISGRVPFPSPSLPEKLYGHQSLEPTPLNELVPSLSAGLVEVVGRMMRKSPDERYVTPNQVVQALDPYLNEPGGVTRRVEPSRSSDLRESPGAEVPALANTGVANPGIPAGSQSRQVADVGVVGALAMAAHPFRSAPVGLSATPGATMHHGSSRESDTQSDDTDVPVLNPVDDDDEDFIPLIPDPNPEPSLSEDASGLKSRFSWFSSTGSPAGTAQAPSESRTETTTSLSVDSASERRQSRFWLIWLLMLLLLVLALLVVLALPGPPG
jgi:serine/threonine protein kinase